MFDKPDIKIKIEIGDKKLSLTLKPHLFNKYTVKVGRSHSKKHGFITITKAIDLIRKWIVKNY